MEERLGPEAMAQYRDQIEAAIKGIDTSERIGASVSKTSDAIEHALFADRPKHRYLVGAPAKVVGPPAAFAHLFGDDTDPHEHGEGVATGAQAADGGQRRWSRTGPRPSWKLEVGCSPYSGFSGRSRSSRRR